MTPESRFCLIFDSSSGLRGLLTAKVTVSARFLVLVGASWFKSLSLLACGSFLLKSVAFPNPILCVYRCLRAPV
jgi:hypothetical protein